ncbi:MAG TPA: MFS transporter [Kofleriaceae bacterium]|nr:MFS transporter [Kofleriaceae bacterium]
MSSSSHVPIGRAPAHSSAFRHRRMQNWLVLGLTYAAMYMARYNFAFANKALSDEYGFSRTQIGWIITFSTLLYGLSAIFNGPIADRIGGRRAMLIGAAGAAVWNVSFGLGAYLGFLGTGTLLLAFLATMWSLNMYFQSYSALSLIKVNAGWFHVAERGRFSAIFGSMIQSGRAAVYALMTAAVVVALPWQWKFFLPAIIVAVFFVLTYLFVQNSPADAGLGEFDPEDATSGDTEPITLRYVVRRIFTNPVAITIAAAEFCTGLVRKGFEEWFPRYMAEVQHLTLDSPVFQKNAMIIVVAGIAGAFAAGYLSDLVFGHRRPPVAFLGYVLQVISLAVVWRAPSVTAVVVAFTVNSFAISMVHSMLSGTASMDFGGKRAAATAAGMFDGMQYLGGSVMGAGGGWLIDSFGWGSWAPSMIGFSVIGALLMVPLWNARPRRSGGH